MPRRRTVVIATATVLLCFGALFAGGVALLTQTDRGLAIVRTALIPTISAAISGQLHVGAIHGTLFTNLTIDSLELREPNGGPFLATGRIRLTYDPRDLLDRRIILRSVEIENPRVTLVDYGSDDWNFRRALKGRGPNLPGGAQSRFGQYIVVDTATVKNGSLAVRLPWTLPDSLKGAKRDSALRFNLRRLDSEIRREPTRLTRTWRFVNGNIALGRTRLADPDSAGQVFALRRLDAAWVSPPFWFRDLNADVRRLGDSIWVNNAQFNLAETRHVTGNAKVVHGSGLPVRYDIKLHSDSLALRDVAWIENSLPTTGTAALDFSMKNDPQNVNIIEYGVKNMDARSMNSRLRGDMTFGVGGPVLRVTGVSLDMVPANTDLLRQFNGEPFSYDWQGNLTARIVARGGPVNRFIVDNAKFSYADAHVPGAVSSGTATGMVDIYTPALATFRGMDVVIDQLDLRTPRFVNKLFPEISGVVRGKMRLDSLWFDARFTNADVVHADGPDEPSRFAGSGRVTLLTEGVRFDVDMQAAPLSYTTLARSYPGLPLRGLAVGPIKVSGIAEDFAVATTLAGAGGEIEFSGRADAFEPTFSASGRYRVRGVNLRTLFGDPSLPFTSLSASGDANLSGADLPSLKGRLTAEVDAPSRFGEARLTAGVAQLAFDSGHVQINSFNIESSAFTLSARGGLGLVASRRDSLQFSMTADSLGGLRQWFAAEDTLPTMLQSVSDTLRGTLNVRGSLFGSIDTLDAEGLRVQGLATGDSLLAGTSSAAGAALNFDVSNILRSPRGSASFTLDSLLVGGVGISAIAARTTIRDGLAERFFVNLRTAADATLTVSGSISRPANYADLPVPMRESFILVDTLGLRVDSANTNRGFHLVAPARLTLGEKGAMRLDSLVLAHSDTGVLSLRGTIDSAGALNGIFGLDRISLADIGLLAQMPAVRSGRLSATANASGTREQPSIDATVAVRDATVSSLRLERMDLRATYDSTLLLINAGMWANNRQAAIASAALPLDLALVSGRKRKLDRPLTGRLRTDSVDLTLLQSLFPDVTTATGKLNTDVALAGTWERPNLRGQVRLDDGILTLANLGVQFNRVNADLILAGDTLIVRKLGASSGLSSDSIAVVGHIAFTDFRKPAFDLRLGASNFLAIDQPRNASLTISTTRPVTLTGSTNAALIRGGVRIDRGRVYVRALTQKRAIDLTDNFDIVDTSVIRMNELLPSAPTAIVENLTVDNVFIEVGDDVWLRSPEANIKLGGALRVTRAAGRDGGAARLALSDSLTVQRGTYQLNLGIARPSFEMERGVIRFFGDPDLEPALDLSALHVVRGIRQNSNRQDVRIRVNIGGTLNRLSLGLSSADNPPLAETDMLSYLVTGEPANAFLASNANYSDQGATLALRLAGSYLSSRLAGGRFDVVQVDPPAIGAVENENANRLNLASTRVGFGMQVGRNTYLSLSTGFCSLSSQYSNDDPLAAFAAGLGLKAERRLSGGLSLSLGLEPGSEAQSCGRLGLSRTFQRTTQQFGADLFKNWAWR
ncbi:MAG: translocation/assembly module TamB domain-containing protein [Phycisphaerae bacterium]|nr:translocation/assembly module TamB domain-containing protein [Gemmatimonadaceae bacterium]